MFGNLKRKGKKASKKEKDGCNQIVTVVFRNYISEKRQVFLSVQKLGKMVQKEQRKYREQ